MKISSSDPDVGDHQARRHCPTKRIHHAPSSRAPLRQSTLLTPPGSAGSLAAENHGKCDVGHSGNMSILRF